MPPFPGTACKTQPDVWEDLWERVFALKELLKVDDTMLACMINEIAGKHSELRQTLDNLNYIDGTLVKAGFEGVKKLIEEDYAPSGHLIKQYSRDRCRNSFRKYKEKPTWWFRRFDKWMATAQKRDPEFNFTADELAKRAKQIMRLSGQQEQ